MIGRFIANFLGPFWQYMLVALVVLPVMSAGFAGWRAYQWGADRCEIRWQKAKSRAEREAQENIDAIRNLLNETVERNRQKAEQDAADIITLQMKVDQYAVSLTDSDDSCVLSDDDAKRLLDIR